MPDQGSFEVTYTEAVVRDAVKTYVWRRGIAGQKGLWIAEAVMIGLFFWVASTPSEKWVLWTVCTVVLLPPLLILLMWFAHYRNTVGKFHRMRTPRAKFTMTHEGLEVFSDLGAAQIPWQSISEIWEKPTYWMIFPAINQFITLPVGNLSVADRELLRSKVPQN